MQEHQIGKLKDRYVVSWWEGDRRRRYRLNALSYADAKREAVEVVKRETLPRGHLTVDDLWEAYRTEKEGRRVAENMRKEWKLMKAHFGHLKPAQVTTQVCRDWTKKRRAEGTKDGTIWTELGHLRTVMRWAGPQGHKLIDHAPRIERPSKPSPKDRWLTHAEVERLLAAPMAHHIRLAILLMLSTAARVGAVLELTWDRVDFERGQIDLRADADGPRKGRAVVPMNAGLRAALSAAREGARTDYVVEWAGEPVKSIKTGFYAAVEAAGLQGVSPHVLRHTAGVHLAAAGTKMEKISQYLGHSSTAVTERVYARFAPDHMREEADVLDFTKIRSA